MRFLVCILLLTLAASLSARVVVTPSGPIQGSLVSGVQQFLGIPYAVPPVGNLRWKAPILHPPWTSVRNATAYGAGCMQAPTPYVDSLSEDCLFLNVFVPATLSVSSAFPLRPVRVFIHGGGYTAGASQMYPGQNVSSSADSVVVTINYRLGLFGYFVLPELVQESHVLNYGLLDQQLALKWVRANIGSFGGDPNNVMVFGESAGGGSIAMHLIMPQSWNLYNKAVLESPASFYGITDVPTASQAGLNFVSLVSPCNQSTPANLLACLRGLSADYLEALWYGPGLSLAGNLPVIDGVQIKQNPLCTLLQGQINPNPPLIVGNNIAEGNLWAFFLTLALEIDEPTYLALVGASVPAGAVSQVLDFYAPVAASQGYWQALSKIMGDINVNVPAAIIRQAAIKAGNQVWSYVFNDFVISNPFNFLNCTHASELPFVLNTPNTEIVFGFTPAEQLLANQVVTYWTNFHHSGNPNFGSSTSVPMQWPSYRPFASSLVIQESAYTAVTHWNQAYDSFWIPFLAPNCVY